MLQSVHYESSSVPSLPESALLAPGTEAQPPEPAHKLSNLLYLTKYNIGHEFFSEKMGGQLKII
jgi:hypothetical protein